MELPKYTDLINDASIGKIEYEDGAVCFEVKDIREKYANVKFDTDRIIEILDRRYIRYEDIHPVTDFDEKIRTAMKFNPRKKD